MLVYPSRSAFYFEGKVFTFTSTMASLTGQQSCCLCFLEVWQTTQMGSLSCRQKSLSFSPWRGHVSPGSQYSSSAVSSRPSLSWIKDSHRFFRVRLGTGSSRLWVLHRGQSRFRPLWVQYFFRQDAQKLWLHLRTTGSLKISQHMGQERSTSGSESLPAILTRSSHFTLKTKVGQRGRYWSNTERARIYVHKQALQFIYFTLWRLLNKKLCLKSFKAKWTTVCYIYDKSEWNILVNKSPVTEIPNTCPLVITSCFLFCWVTQRRWSLRGRADIFNP